MQRFTDSPASPAAAFQPKTANIEIAPELVVTIKALPAHIAVDVGARCKELKIGDDMKPEEVTAAHVEFFAEIVAAGTVNPKFSAKLEPPGVLSALDLSVAVLSELTTAIVNLTVRGMGEVAGIREKFRSERGTEDASAVGMGSGDGGTVQAGT